VTFRSAYNAAKAALNALTANLRVDLAREYPDIHVSLVMPGPVANEFAKNALYAKPLSGSGSPMKPQTSEEVAATMLNLIEHPVPEIYTNPDLAGPVQKYYYDVAAFEQEFQIKPN
jgi:short-subunit dehydrogenase